MNKVCMIKLILVKDNTQVAEDRSGNDEDTDSDDENELDYEEDTTQDPTTKPLYPFGTLPHCIFQISEAQLTQGTFKLDILAPIDNYALNPILLGAFQKILTVHSDLRDIMQNVDWFDCNYERLVS